MVNCGIDYLVVARMACFCFAFLYSCSLWVLLLFFLYFPSLRFWHVFPFLLLAFSLTSSSNATHCCRSACCPCWSRCRPPTRCRAWPSSPSKATAPGGQTWSEGTPGKCGGLMAWGWWTSEAGEHQERNMFFFLKANQEKSFTKKNKKSLVDKRQSTRTENQKPKHFFSVGWARTVQRYLNDQKHIAKKAV